MLYCCSLPDYIKVDNGELTQILIRFYGNQSQTDEIAIQCEIFDLLSKKSLGPRLYGVFDEGRLEEFLPANSLTCEEIRNYEISRIIAKKLAVVHSLNVPIDKDESWLIERLSEWSDDTRQESIELPDVIYNGDQDWLSKTKEVSSELLSIDFQQEIKFVRDEIFEKSTSLKVFSHNDLHQGNILFAEASKRRPTLTERIVFIDFEYCSYNYRAYDIANHLCEWLFQYGTPDFPHYICYEEKFPTRDDQLNFIHHYLSEIHRLQDTQEVTWNIKLQKEQKHQPEVVKPSDSSNLDECCKVDLYDRVDHVNTNSCSEGDHKIDCHNLSNDKHKTTTTTNGNHHQIITTNNNNYNINGTNTQHHNHNHHTSSALDKSINGNQMQQTIFNTNGQETTKTTVKQAIFTDEEEQLFDEIQPFFLAVSLFWTLWCIKQAQTSNIKFGYWQHAMDRWKLYQQFKSSHLNATKKVDSYATLGSTNH